ncbi:Histone-lysine N-methyltransferase [Quillaja saponaria]|uniref:Histone-lysine N-methyltransferase n=1 Tax=Quillaja saponaria TaxID=32244 RepID=A0AAD7LZC1_QUISA|nr:Histone-lysine N-methyltransferase [Quillaja saponaria]
MLKIGSMGFAKEVLKYLFKSTIALLFWQSDAYCCVCGSSSKDGINCLLECSQCLIRVHQACYGVPAVPKGHWCCRPCRTSSKNIVCVLCGYGGGAMTRALRTRTIVKSLLKAWDIEAKCQRGHTTSTGCFEKEVGAFPPLGYSPDDLFPLLRPESLETSTKDLRKVDMQKQLDVQQRSLYCFSYLKVHNSVTDGVLDATVKQWVHMVCGLWTPTTRCPNVDTMSAFDVSGVSCPRADVVCSVCNRWGGSCIKCRVENCSVQFHPWCAHQKGLLQSETEGVDDENVGFYGRCEFHAVDPICESNQDSVDTETASLEERELTCARTVGYKGRRRDGIRYNPCGQLKSKGGCIVPQEQLNAWIHINDQKFYAQGLPKLSISDVEYDCRVYSSLQYLLHAFTHFFLNFLMIIGELQS